MLNLMKFSLLGLSFIFLIGCSDKQLRADYEILKEENRILVQQRDNATKANRELAEQLKSSMSKAAKTWELRWKEDTDRIFKQLQKSKDSMNQESMTRKMAEAALKASSEQVKALSAENDRMLKEQNELKK